jgi:phospholipid transport system transporter-binding protein
MTSLPPTLTLREASEVLRTLTETLPADTTGGTWSVDASGLRQFDSSALAVLLECTRQANAAAKTLRVEGAPPKLLELARLYGVDGLLPL